MTYDEALAALAGLAPRGWRLGLDRMQEFLRRAELESAVKGVSPKFIHVAGTNGKGSVTAYVQSILRSQGYTTGGFFSPFVYDPRERIQINGAYISKEEFARLTTWLMQVGLELDQTPFGGITEFEVKTAMGFAAWAEAKCEWVALEVGLGGRFDATNVITPGASAIVSIGWDHMAILGDTLEKIAFEKAGVIKPGIPCIVGAMAPGPHDVIAKVASEQGAPLWRLGEEIQTEGNAVRTPASKYRNLKPGIRGVHQLHNAAVAIAACEAAGAIRDQEAVPAAITQTTLPGRFEVRKLGKKTIVLDGAHNGESAQALAKTLAQEFPGQPFTVLAGMLQGHDPTPMFAPLTGASEVHLVPINFHRTRNSKELQADLLPLEMKITAHETATKGLEAALHGEELLVITGSFYLVGEIGQLLSLRRE